MSPANDEEREYMSHVSYASAIDSLIMQWCVRGLICLKLSQ